MGAALDHADNLENRRQKELIGQPQGFVGPERLVSGLSTISDAERRSRSKERQERARRVRRDQLSTLAPGI
jgi:hypothetical protein